MTRNQDAIRKLFEVRRDSAGNLPLLPDIFPNYLAPTIRNSGAGRELIMMHWGMPNPPQVGGYSTNIRNALSPHWRQWLKPKSRCLVPATSFAEYAPEANPATKKKDIVWFAISKERPLFAFAGLWTECDGIRGGRKNPTSTGKHLAYAFLTTQANAVVAPIHRKAMPVILHEDGWETWLSADDKTALKLQRPWPDAQLKIVARGTEKKDEVEPA